MKTSMEAIESLPIFAAARASDPATSKSAAARAPVRGHCRLILDAIGQGPAGQSELARRAGLTVAAVSKRLPELRRLGLIERTGREVAGGECEYRNTKTEATDGTSP